MCLKKLFFGVLVVVFSCALVNYAYAESIDEFEILTEQYPPYNFQENDELKGITLELVDGMLRKMGASKSKADIRIWPWARAYKTVQENSKTILFSMTRTVERENMFKWVGPTASSRTILLARKDSNIRISDPSDFAKYRIGVVRDDIGQQRLVHDYGINKDVLARGADALTNVKKLDLGRIDCFAYDEKVAKWTLKNAGLNVDDFEEVYIVSSDDHYIAFHKETSDQLIAEAQTAVDEIKSSGEYDMIVDKYLK